MNNTVQGTKSTSAEQALENISDEDDFLSDDKIQNGYESYQDSNSSEEGNKSNLNM